MDLPAFRTLRLRAVKETPGAFGATVADERKTADKTYLLGFGIGAKNNFLLGGFVNGELAGVVGFRRFALGNLKHKGAIWGMYVAPEHRKRGMGAELLKECLVRAAKKIGLELVQLAVESGNKSAIGLYQRAGFRKYAVEKRGLKVGRKYYDEFWMQADLPARVRG